MANTNTLTYVIPQLLAQGLLALRQMAIMPRFVNRGYEVLAGEKGSTIDIPIPSAIAVNQVSPSYVPPDDTGVAPTKVSIALDQWWEAPFFLSDQDMQNSMDGTIPMQATEAVKAIANKLDVDLITLYKEVYGNAGTPGTTPFSTDLSEFLLADQVLNDQLCPPDNRVCVINARAKANAMALRAFQDVAWRGDAAGITNGQIGEKLGAMWTLDQNLLQHTSGTYPGTGYTVNGVNAANQTALNISGGAQGTLTVGDLINIAGWDQWYTIVSTTGAGTITAAVVSPKLVAATSGSEVITKKGTNAQKYRVNLLFHRDAFALASRPFSAADPMGIGFFQSAVDPISGLTLRLEVTRQHKRTRFSYDILYGVKTVRPELASRIIGE